MLKPAVRFGDRAGASFSFTHLADYLNISGLNVIWSRKCAQTDSQLLDPAPGPCHDKPMRSGSKFLSKTGPKTGLSKKVARGHFPHHSKPVSSILFRVLLVNQPSQNLAQEMRQTAHRRTAQLWTPSKSFSFGKLFSKPFAQEKLEKSALRASLRSALRATT